MDKLQELINAQEALCTSEDELRALRNATLLLEDDDPRIPEFDRLDNLINDEYAERGHRSLYVPKNRE